MLFEDKTKPFSKESIERGYQAVLDGCSRLLTFATSLPIETDSDVSDRQKALAIDDLITFSLHARRLIGDVGVGVLASHISVPILQIKFVETEYQFPKTGDLIAISRLINLIIHHRNLDFFREGWEIYLIRDQTKKDIVEVLEEINRQKNYKFRAKLLVESTEGRTAFIDLSEFILLFIERVFNPLVEACADKGIHLQKSMLG